MNNSTPVQPTTEIAALVDQLNFYLRNVDFNFCMIMIIFPIGLILNMIQLFVFSKRELNLKTNMGSMHAILSFFNMLAIFFSIIYTENKLSRVTCKSIEQFIIFKNIDKACFKKRYKWKLTSLKIYVTKCYDRLGYKAITKILSSSFALSYVAW